MNDRFWGLSLELEIALKYLKKRRHGFFAFLTTIVAIGGIAIAVAAMIIILSVMNGFRADIQQKTLGLQAHVVVSGMEQLTPTEMRSVCKQVAAMPGVKAVAPYIMGQILLKSKQNAQGIVLRGIDVRQEFTVTPIEKMLISGNWQALQDTQKEVYCPIVLGRELARSLHLGVGDLVLAVSPSQSADLGALGSVPKMEQFIVSGIFNAGFYEYDSSFAFVPLQRARSIFGINGSSALGLRVADFDQAPIVAKQIESALSGSGFLVYPWQALNLNLFKALKLEKIMMSILLTIIIVIACFTIISNLILLSIEKARDIGILKALGASRARIGRIFLYAGTILGLCGISLGVVLGGAITWILACTRWISLPQDVYYIDHLPVSFAWTDLVLIVCAAFVITLLAAVYPAYHAAKTHPIDAIRYG